jgi:hypothetical protein
MKQSPPATLVLLTTAFIGSFARATPAPRTGTRPHPIAKNAQPEQRVRRLPREILGLLTHLDDHPPAAVEPASASA